MIKSNLFIALSLSLFPSIYFYFLRKCFIKIITGPLVKTVYKQTLYIDRHPMHGETAWSMKYTRIRCSKIHEHSTLKLEIHDHINVYSNLLTAKWEGLAA